MLNRQLNTTRLIIKRDKLMRDCCNFVVAVTIVLIGTQSVQAADNFWQSLLLSSSVNIQSSQLGASDVKHTAALSQLNSDSNNPRIPTNSFQLEQDLSETSSIAVGYVQGFDQRGYNFGFSQNNLSVSYLTGAGENYAEFAGNLDGIEQNLFHAGLQQSYQYDGYAVDYSAGKYGHFQFGQATLTADGLAGRKGRYFEWNNERLYARVSQYQLASDDVAQGFDIGLALGSNKQLGFQTVQLENGGRLDRIRLQLNGDYSRQYWFDLSSHSNPLFSDNDDYRVMFSFQSILGARELVSYQAQSTEIDPAASEEAAKTNSTFRRNVFIGLGVVAGAALVSSGSSDRDDDQRFSSQQAAAFDVLNRVNPLSTAENREYGGFIVLNSDGSFSPTDTVIGNNFSVNIPFSLIPAGTSVSALIHTHAAFDPRFDNENFSPADIDGANSIGVNSYLATPAGQFRLYSIDTMRVTTLGSIAN